MSIDALDFLAKLQKQRRRELASALAHFLPPPGLQLPEALEAAIRNQLMIQPILARSELASRSSIVGIPSADRLAIEFWYSQYGPDANWLMETGASSGVVALEVDPNLARYALTHLISDPLTCQRTLHFEANGKWQVLFEYVADLPPIQSSPGVRLHSGSSILVPPSRTPSGVELVYQNPRARLLPADWLRKERSIR